MQVLAPCGIKFPRREYVIEAAPNAGALSFPVPTVVVPAVAVQRTGDIRKVKFRKPLKHVGFASIPTLASVAPPKSPAYELAVYLVLAPRNNLTIGQFALWCIEISAQNAWTLGSAREPLIDTLE